MAVRGEEVASSIDAQVRESIERMVAEIRSSIEDVRVVVDQQLKAALQSVQADVNSIAFLPQIQKAIGKFEEDLDAARPPAPKAAPAGGDVSRLKESVQAVEQGRSQVDVLNALLEQCIHYGSRAALLILKGETFSGWKGMGFGAHGGSDETVKRFNAAPGLIPELDSVLRDEQVVIWDGVNLASRFGVTPSVRAVLVPMVIKDKVAAAIYVDAIEDDADKLDIASIELLVFITGLLIDTISIRKKVPSPSLSTGDSTMTKSRPTPSPTPTPGPSPRPAPPPPPPPTPTPKPAPTPAAKPAPSPTAAPAPAPESATVSFTAAQMRDMIAAARPPSFNVPAAEDFSAATPATTARLQSIEAPRPAPAAPPAPPAPPPATGGGDERPSTQYIPPAGVRGGTTGSGEKSEDAKKHDEARRFARLLVSEIKLYNETKVDQGRKNRDLYERLKEDIDRSRQMYDERIGEDVRKASNYFYDELVRILANGNADVLGL